MTAHELLRLAQAYSAATGIGLSTIARTACGTSNNKLFRRIEGGLGVSTKSVERAAVWFAENWPETAEWPAGVPEPSDRAAA